MGNTPPSMEQNTSMDVRKGEKNGEPFEKKTVTYNVGDRTGKISIKKITGRNDNRARKFFFKILDSDKLKLFYYSNFPYRFRMLVEITEGQLLQVRYAKTGVVLGKDICNNMQWQLYLSLAGVDAKCLDNLCGQDATKNTKVRETHEDGIIETSLNEYKVKGHDKQRGLVVIEWKKKDWSLNPYMITVAHYFASMYQTEKGFSVIVRIKGEDLQVDGPDYHPAKSLFEMFDKVKSSGIWTPHSCSHCATSNANKTHHSPLHNLPKPNQTLIATPPEPHQPPIANLPTRYPIPFNSLSNSHYLPTVTPSTSHEPSTAILPTPHQLPFATPPKLNESTVLSRSHSKNDQNPWYNNLLRNSYLS